MGGKKNETSPAPPAALPDGTGPNRSNYATSVGAFPCRGLRRGEIKALRDQGINFGYALKENQNPDEVLKVLAALMLTEDQVALLLGDDIYQSEAWGFYLEVSRLTFLARSQLKTSA